MNIIRSREFTAQRAWGAKTIANMNGISTKLHWTDRAYEWHTNDGQEVFVVLDGRVQMHYIDNGSEKSVLMEVGDIFYASEGTERRCGNAA